MTDLVPTTFTFEEVQKIVDHIGGQPGTTVGNIVDAWLAIAPEKPKRKPRIRKAKADVPTEAPKKRGRPKGSKNKDKVYDPTKGSYVEDPTPAEASTDDASTPF